MAEWSVREGRGGVPHEAAGRVRADVAQNVVAAGVVVHILGDVENAALDDVMGVT